MTLLVTLKALASDVLLIKKIKIKVFVVKTNRDATTNTKRLLICI